MRTFNVCGQVYLAGGFDLNVQAADGRAAEQAAKVQIEAMDHDALVDLCGVQVQEVVSQSVTLIEGAPEPVTAFTAADSISTLTKYVSADDVGLSAEQFLARVRDRITEDLEARNAVR